MPATSKAMRRLSAIAKQVKEGDMRIADVPEGMRDDVKSMMSMSVKVLDAFARTKEKGLPQHAKKTKKQSRRA